MPLKQLGRVLIPFWNSMRYPNEARGKFTSKTTHTEVYLTKWLFESSITLSQKMKPQNFYSDCQFLIFATWPIKKHVWMFSNQNSVLNLWFLF